MRSFPSFAGTDCASACTAPLLARDAAGTYQGLGYRRYKEHKCRFIFRYSALDIGAVARAFALVKLPRMTEFRGVKVCGALGARTVPRSESLTA